MSRAIRRRGSNGKPERSNDLAKIHIAKSQLGLDDSTYRDMLWTVGRVRSAKDLDEAGRRAVLAHLRACGWQDSGHTPTGDSDEPRYKRGTPAALIRWLWHRLHEEGAVDVNTDRALRRYIAKHVPAQVPVDERAPQHLSAAEARSVIEQLKRWLGRVERERRPG